MKYKPNWHEGECKLNEIEDGNPVIYLFYNIARLLTIAVVDNEL